MSCPASSTVGSTRLRTMLLVSALFAIVSGIGLAMYLSRDPSDLEDIKLVLRERHFPEAETRARKWLETHPRDAAAMVLLGEALQRQGSLAEAITVYQGIPGIAGAQAMTAQLALASIFLRQGRLEDAESRLLRLKVDEQHQEIADGLRVTLLSLSGRRFESIPYLHKTLETVGDRFMKLIYLAIPDEMPAPPQDVFARMFQVRDPLGALGCARVAASLGRSAQAMSLIQECLVKRPDLIEAHVALGTLLLDAGDLARFDQWLASLPKTADQHPTTWILRGRRVQDSGNRPEAIRCYWEVLRRQPNHDYSTYQLGQLLAAEGRENESSLFLERAKRLTQLIELSVRLYEDRGAENEVGDCARLTYELGRLQECHAWCEHLLSISPDNPAALELLLTLQKELRPDTPWVLPDSDLAARFDLSSYPLPQFPLSPSGTRDSSNSHVEEDSRISFVDDSERVGLQFVYFNGDDPSSKGKRMFEYTGGGVAALDFDRDGWCDVYFTQGTVWPPDPANHQYLDVMFRNQAGETMQDVTAQTGIQDPGFGQGVAAADFNNDGFADLYVANVDGNRLYRNNGDGTFADVTQLSGLGQHPHWTTSCLVADVNGDSLPDVFDVTFLAGDDIFSRICQSDDGVSRSCAPAGFAAAPDHACINLGDGKFRDMTEQLGFDTPNGDGLGIVAADFDDSGTISLFVGNDGRANFFYVPESSASGELVFREIGVVSGLAYDDSGAAQATMGIAAGDANNDGRTDLFATNFYNESDTLYVNLGLRTFTDRSRSAGFREATWTLLGFGTQFLDADRDGWEDLVVANGHVDDFTHKQIPYKMRPQFFQNGRKSRFVERFGKEVGSFFDQPKLGRGLARLDWNRDGLTDVVISHIGDSAALLTNRTRHAGRGLSLRLVGTTGSRDAVGTRVTVRAGATRLTRQLTGGDGYQATNEPRLEFGLADHRDDVDVEIRWMGGAIENFADIKSNHDYIAVEGRAGLLQLPAD